MRSINQLHENRGGRVSLVRLPPKFRLLESGREYALGVTQNSDGNDVVQLLRLKTEQMRRAK